MSARKLCLGLWLLFAAVLCGYALAGKLPTFEEWLAEKPASLAAAAASRNFTLANDCGPMGSRYLDTAERCRAQLARFWFDEEFPTWGKPCAIAIRQGNLGAGGVTKFVFDRGEVFGWDMRIQGTAERLVDSVIPHEVNHTIFATKFRRGVARWLDEGAAILFEHPEEHRRQRAAAKIYVASPASAFRRLDAREYPPELSDVLALYATGYTLTEWLLAHGGRERLVELAGDPEPPSIALPRIYGMSLDEIEREWRLWIRDLPEDCQGAGCSVHSAGELATALKPEGVAARPKLFVFLSKTCIPCAAYRLDWKFAPGFRNTVSQYFDVEIIEGGVEDPRAREFGVTKTPTFVPANGAGIRIEGYCGPAWLVDHLKPYTRSPLPPGAEPIASSDDPPPSPFKRSEPEDSVEPALPADKDPAAGDAGESGNSGRVLPGIVGTAAGTAAGGWVSTLIGLAIGGPLGAAVGLAAGALVKRLVTRGTSAVVTRAEGAIEQRVDHARERWFPPAQGAPPVAPPAPPVSQPTAGSARIVNSGPVVVETEARPLPPNVVHTSEFIPVEVNPQARAYVWAKRKLVERYPDAASAVEVLESLIKQYRDALAKGTEPL